MFQEEDFGDEEVYNMEIRYCYLDHSSKNGKQCIAHSSDEIESDGTATIEYNEIISPKYNGNPDHHEQSLYFDRATKNLNIKYNSFAGEVNPLYAELVDNIYFTGNEIKSMGMSIQIINYEEDENGNVIYSIDNNFYCNNNTFYLADDDQKLWSVYVHYLEIRNNIFFDYDTWGIYDITGPISNIGNITNNLFYDCAMPLYNGFSSTNFVQDPLFANASSGNFHLDDYSPAINAGIEITSYEYNFDKDGIPLIDNQPDIGCYEYYCTGGSQITISGNPTWNDVQGISVDIIIPSGESLTLGPDCKLYMCPETKIIVQQSETSDPGGLLLINGATITCSYEELWDGIQVYGNATLAQSDPKQAKVEIINGGSIQNAKTGIIACKIENDIPDLNYTGGIIDAENASFVNNTMAVRFYDYNFSSNSKFADCEFIYNADYI